MIETPTISDKKQTVVKGQETNDSDSGVPDSGSSDEDKEDDPKKEIAPIGKGTFICLCHKAKIEAPRKETGEN